MSIRAGQVEVMFRSDYHLSTQRNLIMVCQGLVMALQQNIGVAHEFGEYIGAHPRIAGHVRTACNG